MAIIRLDCNLNGGDSVTPNNELFYRIYGDVDAYASPIHETGTALIDANVTVNNDNVIITGVDGTTNTEFKIAAVDGAGNEGVLSDAYASLNILFEDDFTGNTIDVGKWVLTNPDSANEVDISQDDEIIMTPVGNSTSPAYINNITTLNSFDGSTVEAVSFDIVSTNDNLVNWQFGIGDTSSPTSTSNKITMSSNNLNDGEVKYQIVENSTSTTNAVATLDTEVKKTIKITIIGTTVTWWYWGGASWTQFATAEKIIWAFGTVWFMISSKDIDGAAGFDVRFDNLVVTDSDFSTQRPK